MGILRFKGLIWPLRNFYLRFEGLLEGRDLNYQTHIGYVILPFLVPVYFAISPLKWR